MTQPSWLFIGTFPNCYSYCDMEMEKHGDYYPIARVFFRPLSLDILSTNPKHKPAIEMATAEYEHIKANINTPIQVSATGQTLTPFI